MKKNIKQGLVSLFVLCWCIPTISQTGGFNQQYFFEDRSTEFRAVMNFNNDIILIGESGVDSSGLASIFILRIDTLGNLKKLNFYSDPLQTDHVLLGSYSFDAFCISRNGGIVVFGSMFERNNLFMLEVDSTLTQTMFMEYESDFLFRMPHDVVQIDSFYYVIGLVQEYENSVSSFVSKIDLGGELIWEKTIGDPVSWNSASSAIVDSGGITILGNEYFDDTPFEYNDSEFRTFFIRMDTNGTILSIWKSEINEEGGSVTALTKTENNYYYLAVPAYQPNSGTIWRAAQVACRDHDFNLQWRKTYGDTFHLNSFHDYILNNEGDIISTGQIHDEFTWGVVYSIDPEQGDLNWIARDTGIYKEWWGTRNVMNGITQLPGGSYIAAGYTVDPNTYFRHGMIFKVTQDGCIDTICTSSILETGLDDQIKIAHVYPNPTTDFIKVAIKAYIPEARIKVYRSNGSFLYEQQVFTGVNSILLNGNLKFPGIYYYQIIDNSGRLIDIGSYMVI